MDGGALLYIGMAVALAGSTYATVQQAEGAKEQRKENKKKNLIDQRSAEIENQRNARRAIAARRVQAAELTAAGQPGQVRSNSAMQGAIGSLTTQTASNIGFANTMLGAQVASSNAYIRGQNAVSKANSRAAWGNLVSDAGMMMASYGSSTMKPKPTAPTGKV